MKRGTLLVALVGCIAWPHKADAVIVINEVLADPPAIIGDANQDGVVSATQDEFVELINTEYAPVSLGGWSLADSVRVRHRFALRALFRPGVFSWYSAAAHRAASPMLLRQRAAVLA